MNIILVFFGGGIGASLRYLLSLWALGTTQKIWMGTLIVNLLGCFIYFTLSSKFTENTFLAARGWGPFLKIGLLGSLTTFSTFSFEVVTLFKSNRIAEALLVLFLNIFFGIVIGIRILK